MVSSPDTTSIHQQSFKNVMVISTLQTRSDNNKALRKGITPALNNRLTDRMVPNIFVEKGTSRIIMNPRLTGILRVAACEIVIDEFKFAKKMQKGETFFRFVAKRVEPER
ncbi:hypothetical protein O181_022701 [Austropuccinia psidii MF-1]|uniref:Uncharacterized protein n=1 Tax=Austropuccinia psidii MF-1 TaxID=1389203 RepID=A0A9Q3CDE4_9BASI|nr:hypothetical protein [Austropuccinia psidii MF-1]